jgi:meso-butanediol dehydrogenase / (S,S)-butanediol dehydrogenase / diacetyl reductase
MTGRLQGKVTLISGTGGGQGRVAAQMFAAAGAKVVGCDVDEAAAAETARLVTEAGGDFVSLAPLDISTRDGATKWVRAAVARFGHIDVLYNNASLPRFAPVGEMSDEDWVFTVRNELDLVWHSCNAAWTELQRSRGVIVNVASLAGMYGSRALPQAAHAATKGAVIAFTRQLAAEGAASGIRANCISPGVIRGPATDPMITLGDQGPLGGMLRATAFGKAGEPQDVVWTAIFLASDESAFINGANIVVDGGASAFG